MIRADDVVAAVGVNVHTVNIIDATNTYSNLGWLTLPASLGVRHVRDNPNFAASPPSNQQAATIAAHQALVASGVDMGDILSGIGGNMVPAAITSLTNYVAAGLPIPVSLEGYQEIDFFWASFGFASQAAGLAAVQAIQPTLLACRTSFPGYPGATILGPSLSNPATSTTVGNLEPNLDATNAHAYHNPCAAPEPAGNYYSTFYASAAVTGPDKPVWFTETGMSSGADPTTAWCTELACARLYPRMVLDAVRRGVRRVYFYELLDEHAVANTDDQDRFGLYHPDLTPKQQATALGNMLSLLSDPGPSFTPPADLPLTVSGTASTLQMAKRNGDVWVAVWQASEVVTNPNGGGSPYKSGTDLADTNLPTILTIPGAFRRVNIYRPLTSASPQAVYSERAVSWPVDVLADSATVGLLSQLDVSLVQCVR